MVSTRFEKTSRENIQYLDEKSIGYGKQLSPNYPRLSLMYLQFQLNEESWKNISFWLTPTADFHFRKQWQHEMGLIKWLPRMPQNCLHFVVPGLLPSFFVKFWNQAQDSWLPPKPHHSILCLLSLHLHMLDHTAIGISVGHKQDLRRQGGGYIQAIMQVTIQAVLGTS